MAVSKKVERWIIAYHHGHVTGVEVMRRCKLKQYADLYRIYHHVIKKNKP